MPFIKKCSISFIYLVAAFLTISVITSCRDATCADAKTITLPAKYRHTWYGVQKNSTLKHPKYFICKLTKHYEYFTEYLSNEKHEKHYYSKYRYASKKNNIYITKSVKYNAEPLNFETKNNNVILHYDVVRIKLHR
ncbi:hypothetical protein M2S00_07205 [Apilactobacillus sp. TMW 2.2459]|uniref:hypothetical protein n=1 Tax=Apilactobacillus xinyiensis TaxID=2841032 RepID=UPI00200F728A|nr:hypothetical protein [Apilactobacillus xinyiensis]MCL0312893.1 hypothetical protein [Apilactobacillus xinyiensis]